VRETDSGIYLPDWADTSGGGQPNDGPAESVENRRMLRAMERANPKARRLRRDMERVRARGVPPRMAVPKKRRH
jgi:hypothetical protein